MKLQVRFLILLIVAFAGVGALVAVQHKINIDRSQNLLHSEAQQRNQYFNSIVSLDGAALKGFARDYTFWDDMVNFIKTDNLKFAHEQIDVGLQTFGVDAVWIYKPDSSLLYQVANKDDPTLKNPKLPADFFAKLKSSNFTHFYLPTSNGLIEIRAATVVPSNDPDHKTPAQGYFLAGRQLGPAYITNLSGLSQSDVVVSYKTSDPLQAVDGDSVTVSDTLPDWQGKTVALLRSTFRVAAIHDLNHSYQEQIKLLVGLSILLIVIVAVSIWRLVLLPIKTIDTAIATQQPGLLEPVIRLTTEFSVLAKTVKDFFAQKITIAKTEFEKTELEKLHKEKVAFLAVAAHELNGPINAVRLFSEYVTFLIKKKADEKDIEKMLDRIVHQITKVNLLINDLRGASEGGDTLRFTMKTFDFDSFLKEEIDEAAFTVKHKLLLNGETGQQVTSDPDRLGQVVSNLLRNAYKYSPNADTIHITSKFEDGQVVVGVQDFGLGISEEDQRHIFERFYRATAVSELFPGLGLGLAISKQIIERLGGKIWLESKQGLGSTFYFSLPATPPSGATNSGPVIDAPVNHSNAPEPEKPGEPPNPPAAT